MDIVYPVRVDEVNLQLRYSLRSLDNFEHDRVWLAGYRPEWVTGVEWIPMPNDQATKYQRSTANLRAALEHPGVSDPFVLMNDDFYLTRPIDSIPVVHRGRVAMVWAYYESKYGEVAHRGAYMAGMRDCWHLLERWGYEDPLSYEVHVPMVIHKAPMLEALDRVRVDAPGIVAVHKRTLYGNVAGIGGVFLFDPKVLEETPWELLIEDGFLSSSVSGWERISGWLAERFSGPSPYEGDLTSVS